MDLISQPKLNHLYHRNLKIVRLLSHPPAGRLIKKNNDENEIITNSPKTSPIITLSFMVISTVFFGDQLSFTIRHKGSKLNQIP